MNSYKFRNVNTGETVILEAIDVDDALKNGVNLGSGFVFVCRVGL